jgi:hypothetical protein
MRKVLIGLTLLIATTEVATAQHVEFGIKGGLNLAKFSNENGSSYKMNPSINLGGLAHIHITKSFAIQPELVYSGQGTKFNSDNKDYRYSLGYINVPVLFQLMTASRVRFETGPQLGMLVSAKAKSEGSTVDIKQNFNSTDVAWAFGIGYISPAKFGFDLRYNLGLTDITKSNTSDIKNSVIQAGVFYQF